VSHGLVALGSAAVLSVYTAGYARTRSAAAELNAAERPRHVAPAPHLESAPPVAPAPHAEPPITATSAPAPSTPTPTPHERELAPRTPTRATSDHATSDHAKPSAPIAAPAPAPEPVATPTIVEPPPTPAPTPTPPAAPKWNRHGDIQATVAIENGKIVYAAITVCATRYPCDVIAKLPGQVLERQSPEVDFVAGATESTNAFYYAVVEALKKAK
jgi:hypothetical protein